MSSTATAVDFLDIDHQHVRLELVLLLRDDSVPIALAWSGMGKARPVPRDAPGFVQVGGVVRVHIAQVGARLPVVTLNAAVALAGDIQIPIGAEDDVVGAGPAHRLRG